MRINGRVTHLMGPLIPKGAGPIDPSSVPTDQQPQFAQLYIYDAEPQLQMRIAGSTVARKGDALNPSTMATLTDCMNINNILCRTIRLAAPLEDPTRPNLRVVLTARDAPEPQRYNLPASREIAAIVPDGIQPTSPFRDIVFKLRGQGFVRINELHASYDPLHFPLLFPYGQEGWHTELRHVVPTRLRARPRHSHDSELYDIVWYCAVV